MGGVVSLPQGLLDHHGGARTGRHRQGFLAGGAVPQHVGHLHLGVTRPRVLYAEVRVEPGPAGPFSEVEGAVFHRQASGQRDGPLVTGYDVDISGPGVGVLQDGYCRGRVCLVGHSGGDDRNSLPELGGALAILEVGVAPHDLDLDVLSHPCRRGGARLYGDCLAEEHRAVTPHRPYVFGVEPGYPRQVPRGATFLLAPRGPIEEQ